MKINVIRQDGQYYTNESGATKQPLKIHSHLSTSDIGGAEFKGEMIKATTSSTLFGVANIWDFAPTGGTAAPTVVQAEVSNITLPAGSTMTTGLISGGQFSSIINGTLNGAAILEFGVCGVLDGTGTRTLVAHSAGIASLLHVLSGDEPATGELSSIYCGGGYLGTIDNAIFIDDHAHTTNFLNLTTAGNTGFVTTGGTDCTASGATDPSFTLKCIMPGGAAGYIRVFAAA